MQTFCACHSEGFHPETLLMDMHQKCVSMYQNFRAVSLHLVAGDFGRLKTTTTTHPDMKDTAIFFNYLM